ncbi:hypothetical protein SteCoe_5573 [Stentor coeruleus]|uniref:Uncharacterized protein n=1 Tax=Stentor coeruleus TaxID=5963 RepID=A0A1R2CS03_9CILI|nr:hypothetical protein SteCoe_5573 [Stentor coeruleus]
MNLKPRPISFLHQSNAEKKTPNDSFWVLKAEDNSKNHGKIKPQSQTQVKNTGNFVTRSITPLSSKIIEPKINLDLSQAYKNPIPICSHMQNSKVLSNDYTSTPDLISYFNKEPSHKPHSRSVTDRRSATPSQASLLSYNPTPNPIETYTLYNEKNLKCLRSELQNRRELLKSFQTTSSRKQLEHKYWALLSEIEETTLRIKHLQITNTHLQKEIHHLQSSY